MKEINQIVADPNLQNYANMAIIFTAVFTFLSIIGFYISYRYNKNREFKQKACDLAKYYAEEIIPKISYIKNTLAHSDLNSIINKCFNRHFIKDFDIDELEELLKVADIKVDQFQQKVNSIDVQAIFESKVYTSRNDKEYIECCTAYTRQLELKEDELSEHYALNTKALKHNFASTITYSLNELEWFSMNFVNNLADNKLVYPSLHQTFLDDVTYLYYFVSWRNSDKKICDKLYKNIITLYKIWNTKLNKEEEKIQKKRDKMKKSANKFNPLR